MSNPEFSPTPPGLSTTELVKGIGRSLLPETVVYDVAEATRGQKPAAIDDDCEGGSQARPPRYPLSSVEVSYDVNEVTLGDKVGSLDDGMIGIKVVPPPPPESFNA